MAGETAGWEKCPNPPQVQPYSERGSGHTFLKCYLFLQFWDPHKEPTLSVK